MGYSADSVKKSAHRNLSPFLFLLDFRRGRIAPNTTGVGIHFAAAPRIVLKRGPTRDSRPSFDYNILFFARYKSHHFAAGGPESVGPSGGFEIGQGVGHASQGRAQASLAGGGIPRRPGRQGKKTWEYYWLGSRVRGVVFRRSGRQGKNRGI